MAAVIDAAGPSSAGATAAAGSAGVTWSHTCTGSNRLLVVGVAVGVNPDTGVTCAVTYNGVAMTGGTVVHSGGTTAGFAQLFSLVAPATGANTVAVTLTGGTATISAGSVSFTGADQTTPLGTIATNADANTAGTAASVAVTGTTAGNPVVDLLAQGSGAAATVGAGQTSQWQRATDGATRAGCGASSTETSAGGTVTMAWTLGSADHWAMAAVEVLPASGGGGGTAPTLVNTYTVNAASNTATTAAFTPAAGEVLVAKAGTGGGSHTITGISGGGLTWTSRSSVAASGTRAASQVWTAVVGGSPSSMTVAVTFGGTFSASVPMSVVVERWSGATLAATPAVGTPTNSATAPPSATVTTTAANSVVTWFDADFGGSTGTATYLATSGTPTENFKRQVGGAASFYSAYQTAATAGAKTIGMSAPTNGGAWSMVGLELLAASGPATLSGAAALTAAATLTVGASRGQAIAAPLAAADTLAVAAAPVKLAAAALTGADTVAADAARTAQVAAALTAADTLTVAADRAAQVAAPLTGADTLTTGAGQIWQVAAALTAADTLTTGAVRAAQVAAAPTAADTLVVAARQTVMALAALTAADTLLATPGQAIAAALTAADTLAVADPIAQGHAAAVDLTTTDELDVDVFQEHVAAAALTGADTVEVGGTRIQPAAAALTAVDTLTAAGTRVKLGVAPLAGADTLTIGYVLRAAVVVAPLSATDALNVTAAASGGGALNISVWAVDRQQSGKLVPLSGVVSGDVSDIANDAGAITIAHLTDGSRGDLLLRRDVGDDSDLEVEVWLGGRRSTALRGYLDSVEGDDVAENGVRTYSGNLMLSRLGQAVIAPQPADEKLEYRVAAATPGAMALQLLAQAQARGVLTDITTDFTATHDSEGTAWPELFTGKWSPGTSLLEWVQSLVDLALCETELTAQKEWRLHVFGGRGVARISGLTPVTLRRGLNLGEAGRRATVRGAGTDFLVAAGEGNYRTETVPNARSRRGRAVELSSSVGTIDDPSALIAAAQRVAASGTSGAEERSFGLSLTAGQPRPVQSFDVGDILRVDTDGALTSERVAQWQLSWDATSLTGSATTGDLIRSRMAGLLKRLSAVDSGTAIIGTSEPTEDTGVPLAPTGLVVGSQAFLTGQDVYAAVTAGWLAVQSNVDGTAATDLAGYRVEWALEASPSAWQFGADVDSGHTSASWPTAPGVPIRVRVQCYDNSGNRSAWSNEVTHLTEDDATAPPVTSAPVVSDFIGTLRITWDGLSAAGLDMPAAAPDFSHVELHLSVASNFTPDPAVGGTLVTNLYARGTWTIADLPIGVTQFARLVAVDIRGNRSAASAQGSDTPRQLLGPEIFDGAVGSAKLADLAVVRAKIADLAVNSAKIADLSVGKLTAGTMTADVIVAGIFRTALTGGRTETDNAGIRLYDTTGAIRVNLATATGNALVTGEYRSALSGRRFVINPLGTTPDEIDFYRSSGPQFGRIRAIDTGAGVGINIRSGVTAPALSAEMLVTQDQASMLYGDIANQIHRSRIIVDNDHSYMSSPVVDISADLRYATGDANQNRVSFFFLGTNGAIILNSLVEFRRKVSDEPWLQAPYRDSGIVFGKRPGSAPGWICASNNAGGFQTMAATDFLTQSGRDAKTNIQPVAAVLDPLDTIRNARAQAYVYRSQQWRTPPPTDDDPDPAPVPATAPQRVGPIAEDLPDVLVQPGSSMGDTDKMISLGDQIGVLWGAVGQLIDLLEARGIKPPPPPRKGKQ